MSLTPSYLSQSLTERDSRWQCDAKTKKGKRCRSDGLYWAQENEPSEKMVKTCLRHLNDTSAETHPDAPDRAKEWEQSTLRRFFAGKIVTPPTEGEK